MNNVAAKVKSFFSKVFAEVKSALRMYRLEKKLKKEHIKRSKGEKIIFTIMFIILCLHSLTFIIAYLFVFMNTFKGSLEYILSSKFALPKVWKWNYGKVFTTFSVNGAGYFDMIIYSLWFMLTGSIPSLLSTAMASYAYSRYKFPGRKMIFFINVALLTISLPGSGPAYYKLFCDLGMRNSWKYIFGCFGGFGSQFIIFSGFWKSVDWAYAEAAYIDGGTDSTVFWKIMLPQAMPMMGVFFLLSFIGSWTNYEFTMLYMPRYPSIAFGLYAYQSSTNRSMDMPLYFSGLILTAIPSIILYISFQDRILQTMNIGGLKG